MSILKANLKYKEASPDRGEFMECRVGCGACCIAPSISSPIPGMLEGKPAGVRCIQLTEDNKCKIFGDKSRPRVCSSLKASEEFCGQCQEEAMKNLSHLEAVTCPGGELTTK